MATLLQTKELDESMPDALGILPEHKKQKKLLLDQELLDCSEQHPEGQSNARSKPLAIAELS